MKTLLLLGLVILSACSKPGPSEENFQKMIVPMFFSPLENFKVANFKIESNKEFNSSEIQDFNLDIVRYVISLNGVVVNDCKYTTTTVDQESSGLYGIVPSGSIPRSTLRQDIHKCITKADEDKQLEAFKAKWNEKLGQLDSSNCPAYSMACSGVTLTAEMIEEKVAAFKTTYAEKLSTWKVLKAGEKIEIKNQYVLVKKPKNADDTKWFVTSVGTATDK
jgi:hypothetical protein